MDDIQREETFEPLLTVEQAADLFMVHPKTLQSKARSGLVPSVRIGKFWRFRKSSLDAWVNSQLISSVTATAR